LHEAPCDFLTPISGPDVNNHGYESDD
jgi:hypothetical protein